MVDVHLVGKNVRSVQVHQIMIVLNVKLEVGSVLQEVLLQVHVLIVINNV